MATLYEERIAEAIKRIEARNLSDSDIIKEYRIAYNRYVAAVVDGSSPEGVVYKYLHKKAYRRVASRRGIKLSAAGDNAGKA